MQVTFSEGAYPKREREKRSKESSGAKKAVDAKYEDARDDSAMSVLLFPGQGSQFVGMAAGLLDVPNVRDMFDRASQILDYDLLRLCLEGPEDRDRFMIQPAPSPNTWLSFSVKFVSLFVHNECTTICFQSWHFQISVFKFSNIQ